MLVKSVVPEIELRNGTAGVNIKEDIYYTPSEGGTGTIKSLNDICYFDDPISEYVYLYMDIVVYNKDLGVSQTICNYDTVEDISSKINQNFSASLENGENTITYSVFIQGIVPVTNATITKDFTITYTLYIVDNLEQKTKWTAKSVVERALRIAEPLRQGETERFKLENAEYSWLNDIETPEFNFTQSNLREILKGVGQFIHAEPRLYKNNDNEYILKYDKYGRIAKSSFVETYKNYATLSLSQNLDAFATNIDSSVGNMANTLNDNATITEPFGNGFKSVLTESIYVRITDQNMIIHTQYPIRDIKKLTFKGVYGNASVEVEADITPYVYEINEYNKLSSYNTIIGKSKAYALYYTIGEKNIKGLNFKDEDLLGVWKNYSIINIIQQGIKGFTTENYYELAFQIEYVPFYSARVQQNKSLIDLNNIGKEWTKPYNQGQNLVEAEYFGENLKGVIARMGNIDKTITYVIKDFPTILPNIGELYDNDYYISNVATEIYPYYTKITLALSKDFNKYNEYIGINSTKRLYEISEQQAFDSQFTYREFIIFNDINDNIEDSYDALPIDYTKVIKGLFNERFFSDNISCVIAQGVDEQGEELGKVILPVISSTLGNAFVLSFKYEDNFSAGTFATINKITDDKNIVNKYCYANSTPYTDEYGRIKYLHLNYISNAEIEDEDIDLKDSFLLPPNNNGNNFTGESVLSTGEKPFLIEKENTEILSINYQLEFVTSRDDIIIGSALAKNISFIKENSDKAKLYLLNYGINKFSNTVNLLNAEEITGFSLFEDTGCQFKAINPELDSGKEYNAWALVNEKNELLIGCNMLINDNTKNIFENGKYKGIQINIKTEKELYN